MLLTTFLTTRSLVNKVHLEYGSIVATIQTFLKFVQANLPHCYKAKYETVGKRSNGTESELTGIKKKDLKWFAQEDRMYQKCQRSTK